MPSSQSRPRVVATNPAGSSAARTNAPCLVIRTVAVAVDVFEAEQQLIDAAVAVVAVIVRREFASHPATIAVFIYATVALSCAVVVVVAVVAKVAADAVVVVVGVDAGAAVSPVRTAVFVAVGAVGTVETVSIAVQILAWRAAPGG